MTRRSRVGFLAVVVLVTGLLLAPPAGQSAVAAGVPGRFAWLESVDRGDHYRLMASTPSGTVVLAPTAYGRPAFSPDGTQVAYSAPVTDGSDGRYALHVVYVDGSNRRRLTAPTIGDFDPVWSPDSTRLAVSRDERGNFEASCCTLWLVAADGSGERRLATATSARQPAFSPDGGTLAYAAPEGIRVQAVDGPGNRLVAGGALTWPVFAPGGSTLAAVRRTGAQAGTISLMPFTGGTPVDTAAGAGGGLPEAPVFESASSLLHLNSWGEGEDGRTRSEVRRTTVGGGTATIHATGRPMFYFAWTAGRACGAPLRTAPPPQPVDSPALARFGAFYLRGGYTSGPATGCVNFGNATGDVPLVGDWDGDGTHTPGVFRAGRWYLSARTTENAPTSSFVFGSPGDVPVVGDWDGNGTDTIGIVRGGTWHLRRENSAGSAQAVFVFGTSGDVPVVGDWNEDGTDTVGVFRGGAWHLTNRFGGVAEGSFRFGNPGDQPVPGDWNRDGTDTLAVYRGGTWYLSNFFDRGVAQGVFQYGRPGDRALLWR